jgi:opacity protein-like surface antigen
VFRYILGAALVAVVTAPAAAQVWEITPHVGYVTSSSIDLRPQGINGEVVVDDGIEYGVSLGVSPKRGFTFEGRYTMQPTNAVFDASGAQMDVNLTDLSIHQIHGNFLLWKAYPDNATRPYFLIGLGASIFDSENFDSDTQFSWALGLGVMRDMSEKAALRAQVRYIPTYMTESYGGTWCDPFYGCYAVGDPEYLNQWEFSLGLALKFGQY